jgi:hypothetical protein
MHSCTPFHFYPFAHVVRGFSLTAPSKSPRVVKTTPILKWILAESAMGCSYNNTTMTKRRKDFFVLLVNILILIGVQGHGKKED